MAAGDLAARLRLAQRALRGRLAAHDTLRDLVRAVNSTLLPEQMSRLLVQRAGVWIPAPCWVVVGFDGTGQCSVLAEHGLDPALAPVLDGVAAWIMGHGEDFISADVHADRRTPGLPPASVVAFLLAGRGRHVGALIGVDARPSARVPEFAPSVLRSLHELLEPAACALESALLLKRAEGLSVTDDLTGLYNLRYLHTVLRRETKRAIRGRRPLSLIFLDLDSFKGVNNAHGHLVGSRALVETATVIGGSARETDVVVRYGGDEFVMVLPDTDRRGASAVAERVRARIEQHRYLAADGLDVRLTASVGVATLPETAATAEELLHAADAAMYRVKDRGKNGIASAAPPADT